MNLTPQNQFSSKASQLLAWGHWFTLANIALALLISLSYLFADPAPTTVLGKSYMLLTWLGHTAFITFLAFVLTIFPLSLVFPYPKHIRGMASVLATAGMTLLGVDAFVYFNLGYHLNFTSLSEILSLFWRNVSDTPALSTLFVGTLILLVLAYQLLVSNYAWHHLGQLKGRKFGRYIFSGFVCCFALSHTIHIWADANLKFDVTKQDNMLPLSYPTTAKSLLAKNDLLDLEQYKQARSFNLSEPEVNLNLPQADTLAQCSLPNDAPKVSIRLFSTDKELQQFVEQSELHKVAKMVRPSNTEDTYFNLLYALPSYYKNALLNANKEPIWYNSQHGMHYEIPGLSAFRSDDSANLHVALDKSEREHNEHTVVFAFSLQNNESNDEKVVINTPVYSSDASLIGDELLIQPQDLIASIFSHYWQCEKYAQATMIAHDMFSSPTSPAINYTQNVFVAIQKDKITLVNKDGTYKHISATQGFTVEQPLDIPYLTRGIKELKRFSAQ